MNPECEYRKRLHQHFVDTFGIRSTMMIILGVLWIVIGYYINEGYGRPLPNTPHALLPQSLRSFIWITSGGFAIVAALAHRWKATAIGYLNVMPLLRTTSYLWSWVLYEIPGGPPGEPGGMYYASIHAVLVVAVMAVAALTPRTPPDRGDLDVD